VQERRLDLLVNEAELAKRCAELTGRKETLPARGYDRLFRESVLQAPEGCDFGFLRPQV
jgi:dihydroxy-acid dehydratase